jgi:hypothetical protein
MNPARNSELTAAIEQLYTVFANYRPSAIPQFCSHCVTAEEDALLRSKPLPGAPGMVLLFLSLCRIVGAPLFAEKVAFVF